MRSARDLLVSLSCLLGAANIGAQERQSRLDSLDFSGLLLANFQYHADTGVTRSSNKFDVERVYLTFAMPVGERLRVRVTTDVFQAQSADGTVKGWILRAKYAYLQYDFGNAQRFSGLARFGIVPTVIIDHEEPFWLRYIAPVELDRAGILSPADGGISALVKFPNSSGELFASITNGPGYTSRESDRFKDYSSRITFTPLASRPDWKKSLTLTGWIYRGALGSAFASGGAGQIGNFGSALPRNRWGVLVGARDPRVSASAHFGGLNDASETGANTIASPRVRHDSTGRFISILGTIHPGRILSGTSTNPIGLAVRFDEITTNRASGIGYRLFIGGVTADLSTRVHAALDYQLQSPRSRSTVPLTRIYYAHVAASF